MKRPNIDRSRELRKNQTDAERKLWSVLRDRQLGGVKFRRQFPIDTFILDFFAPEHNLAVEADGGQHYDDSVTYDAERTNKLAALGIEVIRFSNRDILLNVEGVSVAILNAIEKHRRPPSP